MNIPTHDELIASIDTFLDRHGIGESRFGRDSTGEPGLVASIRKGRSPTLAKLNAIFDFMAQRDAALAPGVLAEADSHPPFPAGSSPTSSPTSDRRPSSDASPACSNGSADEEAKAAA